MFVFVPVLLAAASIVSATAVQRDTYFPKIVTPNANSVWISGTPNSVTWDSQIVPQPADTLAWANLYNRTDHSGAHLVATLASDIDPHAGNVSVNVPAHLSSGYYYVILGKWGDVSPEFYIDDGKHPFHKRA